MGAIIIKADSKSNKILFDLAKKLGAKVMNVRDEQFEDFALGAIMDAEKTGENVSRELIMKKLRGELKLNLINHFIKVYINLIIRL